MVDPILSVENLPLCLAQLLGSRIEIPWYWIVYVQFTRGRECYRADADVDDVLWRRQDWPRWLQCSGSKAGLNPKPRHAS